MLEAYRTGVKAGEREEFEEWFGVQEEHRTSNTQLETTTENAGKRHIVSVSLFWKHVSAGDPELPVPTRELLIDARRLGLVKRFSPWECYIEPLFLHSMEMMRRHPEVTFRVYLASDLDFLAEELVELGWEVCRMKSPSIRYCPGGFWRFLALDERDALVTVIDSDRIALATGDIERTELMGRLDLTLWRVPGYYNSETSKEVRYRPILGGHFGARGGVMPVRECIEAFIWHWRHGTLPLTAKIPGQGEVPIKFAKWPDYGFDEWFQLAAMYPRLVPGGTLTFVPRDARSQLLPADIEYATWANPRSECVYF
jgi:hypothetical protein